MDDIPALIQGCITNDRASWNVLFQTCTSVSANTLHKYYTSLSPDECDDVISNIYTKLINGGLSNFRGETEYELLGYFKTIIRNEAISYLRQKVKRIEMCHSIRILTMKTALNHPSIICSKTTA